VKRGGRKKIVSGKRKRGVLKGGGVRDRSMCNGHQWGVGAVISM